MNKLINDCEYLSNLILSQFGEDHQTTSEELDAMLFTLSTSERDLIFKFYQDLHFIGENNNLTNQELFSLLKNFQYLQCHNKIIEILIIMKFIDADHFRNLISKNVLKDFEILQIGDNILNSFVVNDFLEPLVLDEGSIQRSDAQLTDWILIAAKYGSVKVLNYLYDIYMY